MKKFLLYAMALFYVAAGINHFVKPVFYQKIMPVYLPWHLPLINISGACEIIFAILLLPVKTRRLAAWSIIALLIAVFPANIQMFQNYLRENNPYLWITILRLPLQLVLIWGAYTFAKMNSGATAPTHKAI